MLNAIKINANSLKYASQELKNSEDIVFTAIKK